jgi:hypothetical protein
MKKTHLLLCFLFSLGAFAQEKKLALSDMSDFKPQAGNWFVVGDVSINPTIDIHQEHTQPAVATGKRKKSTPVEAPKLKAVEYKSGVGILLNMNDENKKSNLLSAFEHGDIELELEVMLPKGSNSGIYLQGRYEVQLLDSWGVKSPSFSDIGGIYRNWENEAGKSYAGKAPLSNPSKAPGLWQTMKISFRAPKFDAAGKKIANAKFVSVELNGIKIHDNVEVPLPTGGPVENNEKPVGPLMIQGDHGPVAFRNIRYTLKHEALSKLNNISYKLYLGHFKALSDFAALEPTAQGKLTELTIETTNTEDAYAIAYNATLDVPETSTYFFTLAHTGGAKFVVDGKELLSFRSFGSGYDKVSMDLQAGSHSIEIVSCKDEGWLPPRLGFWVNTANSYPQVLTTYGSFPPDENPVQSIYLKAGSEPKLLRAFIDFEGDEKRRLTHTIGVGDPSGLNYVYDCESGNLACAWRGDFVDATPMWHDRGDGSFRPLGATQYFFINQPMAFLAASSDAFPAAGKEGEFRTKGYTIDQSSKLPIFNYIYQGLEVTDKIAPDDNNRSITREITLKDRGTKQGLYFKLAEGNDISRLADGTYVVDKKYYIKTLSSATVREVNGKKELVLSVDSNSIKYSIIW